MFFIIIVLMKTSISKKFILNNLFYIVPICALLFLTYISFNKEIDFAKKEIAGAKLAQSSILLLNEISANQTNTQAVKEILEPFLNMKNSLEAELKLDEDSLRARAKKHLGKEDFKNKFQNLLDKKDFAENRSLLFEITNYIGDSSNLILDPDLDTYYLMDVTIYAIPATIKRINELKILLKDKEANKNKIDNIISILREIDLVRIKTGVENAINEDSNFNGRSVRLQSDVKKHAEILELELDKMILNPENVKNDGELVAAIKSFEINGIDTLVELFEARIKNADSIRMGYIYTAFAVVVFAFFITFIITRSIFSDLKTIIKILNNNSVKISKLSTGNHELSEKLFKDSEQQKESIQSVLYATQRIANMAAKNTESVSQTVSLTDNSLGTILVADNLLKKLKESITEIVKINEQIEKSANMNSNNFNSIFEIMTAIEGKTKVIDDIVFQTKLLSFNASVEAARAGEAGKGFAVVAEEVGNLADLSSRSSHEINELLKNSSQKINSITTTAESEVKKIVVVASGSVSDSLKKVEFCQKTNQRIVANGEAVKKNFDAISIASKEQEEGVKEINKALNDFNHAVKDSADVAHKIKMSSDNITEMTKEISESIELLSKISGI